MKLIYVTGIVTWTIFVVAVSAMILFMPRLAQSADLPLPPPQKQIDQRFGNWMTNPIAHLNPKHKSSSSPRMDRKGNTNGRR